MNRSLASVLLGLTVLPTLTGLVVLALLKMGDQPSLAQYSAVLVLSYLVGSVPWGYMLLAWGRGVDIREYGSGRTGMSNVLRTAGGKLAALVLALDVGKGIMRWPQDFSFSLGTTGPSSSNFAADAASPREGECCRLSLQFRRGSRPSPFFRRPC